VHVNEPGRTAWEGFATATHAAARGGITTIVDMPLNSLPPTTTVPAFEEKLAAASGQLAIDVGFWGGVVPGNHADLDKLVRRGVLGFKCFLIDSGVPEFGWVQRQHLEKALPILRDAGVPLLTHAELAGPCDEAEAEVRELHIDPRTYRYHVASRPKRAEDEAVRMMIDLSKKTKAHVHIVHHSSSTALPELVKARADGVKITVETCPHYLSFAAEDIPDGATHFKCTPPIRERDNNEALWDALAAGVIDMVVSDHSPCTAALKRLDIGDFSSAWGGIASLQLTLPATWTGMRARNLSVAGLADRMAMMPAKLAGLRRKGRIAKGYDADFCVFDPDARFVVENEAMAFKNKITPYAGKELFGVVRSTWLRGEQVYKRGSDECRRNGRTLLRT
jgi:allantoinase